MRVLVSYSGGKDSQACLIQAVQKYGADKITAIFCDTGWEHPDTYQHIEETTKQLGVELSVLKAELGFVDLAKKKTRFPSTKRRFCTSELKVKPMIDYILSLNDSCIIIQGIRANESASRSEMDVECMYFKNYFEPIETNSTKLIKYEKQLKKAKGEKERLEIISKIEKTEERLKAGKEDGIYYTYRKKEVIEYCMRFDASVLRPIFNWTAQQVIDSILGGGQQPNPLYFRGFSRVGCFPCVMCRLSEIKGLLREKDMMDRLIKAEDYIGRSFFPPLYIPKWACANKKYPMIRDVFKYVTDKNLTKDMFEPEEGYSCMSLYHGLCE